MNNFKIDNKILNEKSNPFIVAEIGINFNGSIELAKKTILAAKKSGANSVKFQYYKTEDFISNKKINFRIKKKGKTHFINQYNLFKKNELTFKKLVTLKEFSDKNNIHFHATPTNPRGVDELIDIGVDVIKNGSDYLTHIDVLKKIATTKIPVVISTGMSLEKEIKFALSFFKEYKKNNILLLHCVSNYPTKTKDANINRLITLKKKFRTLTGFSDHTEGCLASILAKINGSVWFEKHFTLNKKMSGPDHKFSSDSKNFSEYVKNLNNINLAFGDGEIDFKKNELYSRLNFSLSLIANENIKRNSKIKRNMLSYKRPGTGIKSLDIKKILRSKVKVNIKKDQVIKVFDLKKF